MASAGLRVRKRAVHLEGSGVRELLTLQSDTWQCLAVRVIKLRAYQVP